jgi:hypothetical protein
MHDVDADAAVNDASALSIVAVTAQLSAMDAN